MGHCYSLDLRVRVADFVEAGHSCRAAARHGIVNLTTWDRSTPSGASDQALAALVTSLQTRKA
jgi:hypothetical protein